MRSPIRYYGGKQMIAPWIVDHFPEHVQYVEPFGGGAAVLLAKPPSAVETYNDLCGRISCFWRVLRDHGEEFARRVSLTPYSEVEFKLALTLPDDAPDMDRAVAEFILNRQSVCCNRQNWTCSVRQLRAGSLDAWWSAIDLLPEIVERIRKVQILCRPAIEVIQKYDRSGALFYCDPPYVHASRSTSVKGECKVYRHEMTDDDHRQLANVLHSVKGKVILSGYPGDLYDTLYHDWRREEIDVSKPSTNILGIGNALRATEVLWMNYEQPGLLFASRKDGRR